MNACGGDTFIRPLLAWDVIYHISWGSISLVNQDRDRYKGLRVVLAIANECTKTRCTLTSRNPSKLPLAMTIVGKTQEQKLAVRKDVEALVAASERYIECPDTVDGEAKLDLQMKAAHLIQNLRGPVPSALAHFENVSIWSQSLVHSTH